VAALVFRAAAAPAWFVPSGNLVLSRLDRNREQSLQPFHSVTSIQKLFPHRVGSDAHRSRSSLNKMLLTDARRYQQGSSLFRGYLVASASRRRSAVDNSISDNAEKLLDIFLVSRRHKTLTVKHFQQVITITCIHL
jgi:hypothetical protein